MSTSLAELNDRVYLELEVAAEFCSLDKIHNAVVQQHNIRAMQARQSSINNLLGVSAEFTPTTTEYDISALIGKGIPAWIEYEDSDGKWQPMRIVNTVQIADYTALGMLAAAFHAVDASTNTTEPVQYVTFSFVPSGPVRIRFDRDIVRKGVTENAVLPDHTTELIVKGAQNTVIPRIKLAIDMRCRRDPELKAIARELKQSLTEMKEQNLEDMRPLVALWKGWAFRDRSTEGTFTKPTPSSRGLYGGS